MTHVAAVLVAARVDVLPRLLAALAEWEVRTALSVPEAVRRLRERRFDVLVLDRMFDDSRMFEVIDGARRSGRNDATPIVCFRDGTSALGALSTRSLERSLSSLGIRQLVDLTRYDGVVGDALLRAAVNACLPPEDP